MKEYLCKCRFLNRRVPNILASHSGAFVSLNVSLYSLGVRVVIFLKTTIKSVNLRLKIVAT